MQIFLSLILLILLRLNSITTNMKERSVLSLFLAETAISVPSSLFFKKIGVNFCFEIHRISPGSSNPGDKIYQISNP